jgi:ribosomal protein S18 acetylase RimI-like enzyme
MPLLDDVNIRSVREKDANQITKLIQFGDKVHQHLDWSIAIEWIGYSPYIVAERNYSILAALACPPDPDHISWIRLFAASSEISFSQAWNVMWNYSERQLTNQGIRAAAIASQSWFQNLLDVNQFSVVSEVVLLEWKDKDGLPKLNLFPVKIRSMVYEDLNQVHWIDQLAFTPLWQNSKSLLEIAFSKASICTVALKGDHIVGFQISSADRMKGHLARLAVHPSHQGQGVGFSLVADLLNRFNLWGTSRVTVNTQADNIASLSLYKRLGFQLLGESYPVFLKDLKT